MVGMFGYYFNASLGFNGRTLRVFGLVRYVVVISLFAAGLSVVLYFALIPSLGALGAALGTLITLLVHNVLKQGGLRRTGISVFDPQYRNLYFLIAGAAASVFVITYFSPSYVLDVAASALICAFVLWTARRSLRLADTFPELMRLPLMSRIYGDDQTPNTHGHKLADDLGWRGQEQGQRQREDDDADGSEFQAEAGPREPSSRNPSRDRCESE